MTTREWMTLVALTALITAGSVGAVFVLRIDFSGEGNPPKAQALAPLWPMDPHPFHRPQGQEH